MSVFRLVYWSGKEAADCPAALYVSLTLKFCYPLLPEIITTFLYEKNIQINKDPAHLVKTTTARSIFQPWFCPINLCQDTYVEERPRRHEGFHHHLLCQMYFIISILTRCINKPIV